MFVICSAQTDFETRLSLRSRFAIFYWASHNETLQLAIGPAAAMNMLYICILSAYLHNDGFSLCEWVGLLSKQTASRLAHARSQFL